MSKRGLGRRGTTSLEFCGIAAAFFMMLVGTMEIGRYLFIVDSLRTLTGEAARAALVAAQGGTAYSASTVEAIVPVLNPASITLNVSACTSHVITVSASYPFTSVMPSWTSMNGALTTASFSTQIAC